MDPIIGNMELTVESVKQTDKDARIYAEELINGKINS